MPRVLQVPAISGPDCSCYARRIGGAGCICSEPEPRTRSALDRVRDLLADHDGDIDDFADFIEAELGPFAPGVRNVVVAAAWDMTDDAADHDPRSEALVDEILDQSSTIDRDQRESERLRAHAAWQRDRERSAGLAARADRLQARAEQASRDVMALGRRYDAQRRRLTLGDSPRPHVTVGRSRARVGLSAGRPRPTRTRSSAARGSPSHPSGEGEPPGAQSRHTDDLALAGCRQ
jgi:hypothetical protein